MSNTNPIWKPLLLAVILVGGILYALPNLFGSDPAVQVSGRNTELTDQDFADFTQVLGDAGFAEAEIRQDNGRFLALFNSEDDQIKARDAMLASIDGGRFLTSLDLKPAGPAWLRALASPMNLGLDLRGGVHFLMEVDMPSAITSAEERYVPDWKRLVRRQKIRGTSITHDNDQLNARFKEVAQRDQMLEEFRDESPDLSFTTSEDNEYAYITAKLTEEAALEEQRNALQQNIVTLRNRVNELGVSEPVIQQQGLDRIVVQLPGVQDTARAKEILGATATLEYRLVSSASDARAYKRREDGSTIMLDRDIIVTGDQIKGASSGIDQQTGSPAVFVNLDNAGARRMQEVTQDNVGNLMAVVYIENRIDTKMVEGEQVKTVTKVEEVINAATIRDVLSHRFQTTGLMMSEASNLALLLRAGALKAPVQIVEERTVGPSLGKDNIRQGFLSAVVGLALVVAFMIFYYRIFGAIAGAALIVNVVLIVAVLGLLQATLTLPGIAGIVLTTGMAVDANVLIFERIREELRNGGGIQAAIASGYEKAFVTIADANITTLIAAVVLFSLGTGPIKGFAITLCIGILTSMFTAIFGTRVLVNALYGGRRLKSLPI
ncbi:MAG: protein translocase subunit SecD [Granulosicoccus sp.]|nr:protein translocase subunit SecD [Granulosicoccus sp.]